MFLLNGVASGRWRRTIAPPVWRRLFYHRPHPAGRLRYWTPSAAFQTTCEKLHIPFNDWLTLSEEMQRLARPQGSAQGNILTRGVGGRGYSTAGCVSPTRILSFSPFRRIMRAGGKEGITLTQSRAPGAQLWLAGLKHLNRPSRY